MKYRTTRKAVKEQYKTILKIGYCNLQLLLSRVDPFAYSTRAEGWACDYYYIGNDVVISTGYAPIGKPVSYDICREYEKKAQKALEGLWDYTDQRDALDALIEEFAKEVA